MNTCTHIVLVLFPVAMLKHPDTRNFHTMRDHDLEVKAEA